MIKLTFCLRRLPTLTRAAFQDYWFNHHAPLVRQHAPAMGLRRYVQVHALADETSLVLRQARAAEPPAPYDGIAELWFDSLEALARVASDPAGRAAGRALLEDERKFIDLPRSPLWFNEERVIVGAP